MLKEHLAQKGGFYGFLLYGESIALAFVGEILGLDIGDVLADGIGHDGGEIGIAARVLRIKWFSGKIIL